jgi:hypothetical protein
MGTTMWPYRARIRVHAPVETVVGRTTGLLEAIDEHSCVLTLAGDSLGVIAVIVGLLDVDFDVLEPPELIEHIAGLADRYERAALPPTP